MDLASPNLDTYSVSDKPGGALPVWRGVQGGAFVPHSDHKFSAGNETRRMAFPMAKQDGGMTGKLLENPGFLDPLAESTGVQTVSKKRRVLAQVNIDIPIIS